MTIGTRIRHRRTHLNLSQEALAKRVNSQQQSVARWEIGENAPRRHTIRLLAEALEVSVIWLEFGGAQDPGENWSGPTAQLAAAPPETHPSKVAQPGGSPIYLCATEDSLTLAINSGEEIETGIPPARYKSAPHIYGLYLPDDRLAPRFRAGELIWLHPQRPPKIGDETLAIPLNAKPTNISAVLGTLLHRDGASCRLKIGSHELTLSGNEYGFHLVIGLDLCR